MSDQAHYTEIEVEELIQGLTDSQIAKMLHVYRNKGCQQRAGLSGHDVFQNAVMKALSKKNCWKKGIPAEAYLIMLGKNYISNEEKKYSRNVYESQSDNLQIEALPITAVDCSEHTHEFIIQEWVGKIVSLFADDKDASCFLKSKLAQAKKAKILALCRFTDQAYRNVEKRIKDKARKRFPGGVPFNEATL